jgi:hypothetical protein
MRIDSDEISLKDKYIIRKFQLNMAFGKEASTTLAQARLDGIRKTKGYTKMRLMLDAIVLKKKIRDDMVVYVLSVISGFGTRGDVKNALIAVEDHKMSNKQVEKQWMLEEV